MAKRRCMTMDGNTATAHVSYAFTEVATIFPITPSSVMAEAIDEWSAKGRKNLFGNRVLVRQMQSEAGAVGAMHGSLQGGALTSTYTASQGLMLMLPVMYRIAGELLPGVFHVASRSLGTNAFSIFGDHQDVMATRGTGAVLLASSSVQDCMDLSAVAHLSAIKARLPVVHFFDGFRTSHEMQKIEVLEYEELRQLLDEDAIEAFRSHALNPDHPVLRGVTQNPDLFFQLRESVNSFYDQTPKIVEGYMAKINALTGRNYQLFNYYGSPTAEYVIVAMGSGCDVIRETIAYENARGGSYGLVEVHLYRPFSNAHLLSALPKTVKRLCVLDRTKEPGAAGEPLYLDVRNALYGLADAPLIVGGRFGLSSKEFAPHDVMAVYENLRAEAPMNGFTVGITDDVTHLSLPKYPFPVHTEPAGVKSCKFWGLGSDGTVSANKAAVKIIGDHTDMYAQAYFAYDSKKSGGLTVSHLRFGREPIRSSYQVLRPDFVACHNQAYVRTYDLLSGIKEGGTFLLNCVWSPEELERQLPAALKRTIAEKRVTFYTINAVKIAQELGLGGRINMVMQSAFFRLANILPLEEALGYLKEAVEKSYGKRGREVVEMNMRAIDAGAAELVPIQVPPAWAEAVDAPREERPVPAFFARVVEPVNRQTADELPVSVFAGLEDGTFPLGITQYEKRGISLTAPVWDPLKCIQCNQCAFVCPHGVLRPTLLSAEQAAAGPGSLLTSPAKGYAGMEYSLAISAADCTGCGNCVYACPAKDKAIRMETLAPIRAQMEASWEYLKDFESNTYVSQAQRATLRGSQFLRPLLEFSGACAGCGETPYAKLITQLFGDRMQLANTAGCVTVWGGASPGISYTTNSAGHGPAWGYSLFEDDAEFGFGMCIGSKAVRNALADRVLSALKAGVPDEVREPLAAWLSGLELTEGTRERAEALSQALAPYGEDPVLGPIYSRRDYFTRRSYWIFGGDGWAYDIGYGGLDHVLATGENVNIFVFDTEVYSNTGGQSSKSTPTGAIAKFAAAGKEMKKKDLGRMAMNYGHVYVAQVCMGADRAQTLKAILEAEAYEGPSLIIGYAPCINHGIRAGMGCAQLQQKRAVDAGYWALYRYNPDRAKQGLNPFTLDSREPTLPLEEFLDSESRFAALKESFPERAAWLYEKAKADAAERLRVYRFLNEHSM